MGNFSKGVRSDSAKVVARCPVRNSFPELQSLKLRPALSKGSRSFGIAKAPSASTGAIFKSSRRFIFLNLRSSISRVSSKPTARVLPGKRHSWDSQHTAKLHDFKEFFRADEAEGHPFSSGTSCI